MTDSVIIMMINKYKRASENSSEIHISREVRQGVK